jgi:hypothetical protein
MNYLRELLKTMNHRDTEAQRKARKAEGIPGFLAFDFLCASVVNWFFMGF